jgi:hypothetical protein
MDAEVAVPVGGDVLLRVVKSRYQRGVGHAAPEKSPADVDQLASVQPLTRARTQHRLSEDPPDQKELLGRTVAAVGLEDEAVFAARGPDRAGKHVQRPVDCSQSLPQHPRVPRWLSWPLQTG